MDWFVSILNIANQQVRRLGLLGEDILNRIYADEGLPRDLNLLQILCEQITRLSLGRMGQGAPNLVTSIVKHVRDEYETHLAEKRCPAGKQIRGIGVFIAGVALKKIPQPPSF